MNGSFYESVGNNTITVNGLLSWSDLAGVDYGLYLMVVNNGTVKVNKLLDSYESSEAMTQRNYVVSETLNLNHMDNVILTLKSEDTSEEIQVIFSNETYLQLSDKSTDVNVTSSECYGITALDAFSALLEKMSKGAIQLESQHFSKKEGVNDFITNGNNIRGILSPINLSFSYLFEQMRTLYDIEADLTGDILRIEKAENATPENSVSMGEVKSDYYSDTNIDKLYSSVKAGYRTWQSESKLKGAEYNSIRIYESELNFGSRELDLTLDVITGSYLLEEQRRIQFDPEKNRDGGKNDESVFLIAINGDTVQGISDYSPTSNIIASGGVYNLKYSPAAIIENNRRNLVNIGEISQVSSEGNSVAIISGKREDRGFNFGEKMPFLVNFDLEIEPEMFEGLKYVEVEVKGETKHVKVLEAEMSMRSTGIGVVNIIGEEG